MRRRLFTLASAVSLLLCAAVLVSWATQRSMTLLALPLPTGLSCGIDGGPEARLWFEDKFPLPREINTYERDPRINAWEQSRQPYESGVAGFNWGKYHLTSGSGGAMMVYMRDSGVVRWLAMPPWFMVPVLAVLPTISVLRWTRRIPPGRCQECGYNLTANTSGVCPECGTAIAPRNDR